MSVVSRYKAPSDGENGDIVPASPFCASKYDGFTWFHISLDIMLMFSESKWASTWNWIKDSMDYLFLGDFVVTSLTSEDINALACNACFDVWSTGIP